MNAKYILYGVGGLLLLIIIGGVGYKIVAPTNNTVVGSGGRVVNISTTKPQVPLGGCSLWRVNARAYWEQEYKK